MDNLTAGKVVLVTPEVARETLKLNTDNRTLRPHLVEAYAREMAGGRGNVETNPPVLIGRGPVLIDGQHRLAAVVRSGCSIPMVVREISADTSRDLPVDIGLRRTPRDLLGIDQGQAAIVRFITATLGRSARERTTLATMAETRDLYLEEMNQVDFVQRAPRGIKTAPFGAALVLRLHHVPGEASDILRSAQMICAKTTDGLPIPSFGTLGLKLTAMGGKGGAYARQELIAAHTWQALRRPRAKYLRVNVHDEIEDMRKVCRA